MWWDVMGGGGGGVGESQNKNKILENPNWRRTNPQGVQKSNNPAGCEKNNTPFHKVSPPPPHLSLTFLIVHPWPEGSMHCLDLLSYPSKPLLIGHCWEIAKWLLNGEYRDGSLFKYLRSSHSIEGKRLTEGPKIDTMDMVKCYHAQPSPFPTNPFTPRSEQHYFKFSL